MIPTSILRVWFFGLFSFVLIGIGIYCGHEWYHRSWGWDSEHQRSYFDPHWGYNRPTLFFAVAVALLLWALFGGVIVRALFGILTKAKSSAGVDAHWSGRCKKAPYLDCDDLTAPNFTWNVMVQRVLQ